MASNQPCQSSPLSLENKEMTKEHRHILKAKLIHLKHNFETNDAVLKYFSDERILSEDDCEKIKLAESTDGRLRELLAILPCRGEHGFYGLIEAANRTGQHIDLFSQEEVCNGCIWSRAYQKSYKNVKKGGGNILHCVIVYLW